MSADADLKSHQARLLARSTTLALRKGIKRPATALYAVERARSLTATLVFLLRQP